MEAEVCGKLRPGVYVSSLAFFRSDESVNEDAVVRHMGSLAESGVAGVVVQDVFGEAMHLDRSERNSVTAAARQGMSAYPHVSLLVGCSAASTRATVQLCQDAAEHGADFAVVQAPRLYRLSSKAVLDHYRAVADASPVPLLIKDCGGPEGSLEGGFEGSLAGGLEGSIPKGSLEDSLEGGFEGSLEGSPGQKTAGPRSGETALTCEEILALARHGNVAGVQLSATMPGRIAELVSKCPPWFVVLGNETRRTLHTLVAGGHGIVSGFANLFPYLCVRLAQLCNAGELAQALSLLDTLAAADDVLHTHGFTAFKSALQTYHHYGGCPRLPCQQPTHQDACDIAEKLRPCVQLDIDIQHALNKHHT
ncbi:dihydrodipicolinate synthetase family protein [Gregarina niphandrodes]|uniref:Dihydrodipicolinate synthetase family protein n=1 Tax=Gregarina niphandrodes TaxID=110365 RepID=A0A023BCI9_GRENI|nr:dihydrodipicolinate synthetase family protein [Gregarina niphandrodes]EZG84322.1 dihydrodipicolinate synthetase family protein [Gregarina niphandrodes]|eukprot:XP_011128871.1 dihydrodipicolinate synthetase family protein [Gregarina niphandrodes]